MSKDQVAHLFMGFALVNKFFSDSAVAWNDNGNVNSYNFKQKAREFTHKIMRHIVDSKWSIDFAYSNRKVPRGGSLGLLRYPYREAALRITGRDRYQTYCNASIKLGGTNRCLNPWSGILRWHAPAPAGLAAILNVPVGLFAAVTNTEFNFIYGNQVGNGFGRALMLSVATVGKAWSPGNIDKYSHKGGHEIYSLLSHILYGTDKVSRSDYPDMLRTMDCYGPRKAYDQDPNYPPILKIYIPKTNTLRNPKDPSKPDPRFSNGSITDPVWSGGNRFVGGYPTKISTQKKQYVGLDYMLLHNLYALYMLDKSTAPDNYLYRNYKHNDLINQHYPYGTNPDDWGGANNPIFEYSFKPMVIKNCTAASGTKGLIEANGDITIDGNTLTGETTIRGSDVVIRAREFDCANFPGPTVRLNKTAPVDTTGNEDEEEDDDYSIEAQLREQYGDDLEEIIRLMIERGFYTQAQIDSILAGQISPNILYLTNQMEEQLMAETEAEEAAAEALNAPVLESKITVFPNPFHAGVKLTLELPEAAPVTIKLYTVVGKEVKTLAQGEELPAGAHARSFDLSDLPGGAYVCKVWIGGDFQSFKLMKN